jgi:hypothetical protein
LSCLNIILTINIPETIIIHKNDIKAKFTLDGEVLVGDRTFTVNSDLTSSQTFVFDISRNINSQSDYTIDISQTHQ